MNAKKVFVKVDELKREFYHKYQEQQFSLEHYQSVAAAITAWLEEHQRGALGGFWNGEMRPSNELTDITEIGIVYFGEADDEAADDEPAEEGEDKDAGDGSPVGDQKE